MALIKSRTLPTGITAEYWRICQQNMNYDRIDCVVVLAGYFNQAAREAGSQPLTSVQFDLSEAFHNESYNNGEEVMGNLNRKEAYRVLVALAKAEAAKEEDKKEELAFFADAVSDEE